MLFYTSTVGISHRTRGLNISAPIKSEVLSDNSMRLRCRLLPPLLRMTEILYLKKRSAARDFALPIRRFFERKRMIFWDNFEFYSIIKEDSLPPTLFVQITLPSILVIFAPPEVSAWTSPIRAPTRFEIIVLSPPISASIRNAFIFSSKCWIMRTVYGFLRSQR